MYLLPPECGRTLPPEWGELASTSGMWRTNYRRARLKSYRYIYFKNISNC
jgi:hypothetical protein